MPRGARCGNLIPFASSGLVLVALCAGARAADFAVLHQFGAVNGDAAVPHAGVLLGPGGLLYGTTTQGGSPSCGGPGCGAVYQLTPPAIAGGVWSEAVIYGFAGGDDGASPESDLALQDGSGALIGTANVDGVNGSGTAFALVPPAIAGGSWTFTPLYAFGSTQTDGERPQAGLLAGPDGSYYGTTQAGGADNGVESGWGTVFQLAPPAVEGDPWTQTVLEAFSGCCSNTNGYGTYPSAGVLLAGPNGSLLGTTSAGGRQNAGVAYQLLPPAKAGGAWMERKAFDFSSTSGTKGIYPNGGLIAGAGGAYYGMTTYGGRDEYGVVFELDAPAGGSTRWSYKVIHDFKDGHDGAFPLAGLTIGAGGVLYGSTSAGGGSHRCSAGCGTVFQLTPPTIAGGPWTETVLHAFTHADGAMPWGRLAIDANGVLYGTTAQGGSARLGVAFAVTP